MKLENSISIAQEYLGKEYFSPLNIAFLKSKSFGFLRVTRNNDAVTIEYDQLANLFRGLTLIKEKCNEKHFDYSFKTKFNTVGPMLDCSRNGVLKNEKVKEMILLSALMGHNRLLLYTEDTFKLDKYPYFGYLRGAYSKEDIKEFVKYGESFGVELVPCIQTLGHLSQVLKWRPMYDLQDGSDTLLVDSPKVYQFIEDMISFCRECFKSKEIHIGMDESFEMGLRRHLAMYGYQDRVEMLSRHLNRVKDICKKYEFSPMIWSDMYFRLNDERAEYTFDKPLPESTLKTIPQDVKLVYWDYYHPYQEDYERMIRFHKQANNPIVFAGGSWRWKGFAPSIKKSIEFTQSALNACLKEKVKEVIIAAWGDDGNECSFFTIIPVLAETSVMNYGGFNIDDIQSLVKALTGDNLEDFFALDLPDFVNEMDVPLYYNPSKYLLYQDVLLGMFDPQVKEFFAEKYTEFAENLHRKSLNSQRFDYIYDNLSKLCNVLSIKADIGIRLRRAYKSKDNNSLKKISNELDELIVRLQDFERSNEKQWMIECRPFGYEILNGRFGFLKNRIQFAKKRIIDYLNGDISVIDELEADILPFDGRDDEVSWNLWYRNISPAN